MPHDQEMIERLNNSLADRYRTEPPARIPQPVWRIARGPSPRFSRPGLDPMFRLGRP